MNRSDAAILMIRGFAIYSWLNSAAYLAALPQGLLSGLFAVTKSHESILSFLFPALVYAGIGTILFRFSRQLSALILPAESDPQPAEKHGIPAIASIAFAAVGVWFVLDVAPDIVNRWYHIARITDEDKRNLEFRSHLPAIFSETMRVVLGAALFLKSRLFATTWGRKQFPDELPENK